MTTRLALCTTMVLFTPAFVLACPVCFGAADGAMLQGSNMGILALLVVTLGVLGAFATFFMTLARRSRAAAAIRHDRVAHSATTAPGEAAR